MGTERDFLSFRLALAPGLVVHATEDPASPLLDRFFEGYDRAFILPDEREEREGFARCLAINPRFRHAFGRRHSELVAVIEDTAGQRLGGANFLTIGLGNPIDGVAATVALNYVYVDENARGRGMLRHMLAAVRLLAKRSVGLDDDASDPTLFIEQNDPIRLTPEAYAADSRHSGLDQIERIRIWSRIGARLVDFAYVQPALSAEQEPDPNLIYAAIGHPGDGISPALLHAHFESFFAISVLKGEAEAAGGPAETQLRGLANRTAPIALLAMDPALSRLGPDVDRKQWSSFRALAHAMER